MLSVRLVRSFVAVYEERSFTRAAVREGATQSGLSQHVRQLEARYGVSLFERGARGAVPTPAADRLYRHVTGALAALDLAERELAGVRTTVAGDLKVGLMPSLTRAALAPALERFSRSYPEVAVNLLEAYSGALTDAVRRGDLDFAVVPGFEGATGLRSRRIGRDREMLVAAARAGGHLAPVRLAELGPVKLVVPGATNTRRRTIDVYCEVNGVEVARRMALDAMIGTLELVAVSDFVAILPAVMMAGDIDGARYAVRPLADPPLALDLVLIEPMRRAASPQARAFATFLEEEVTAIMRRWDAALGTGEVSGTAASVSGST